MECRGVTCRKSHRGTVAFQAELMHLRADQHLGIDRSMGDMAGLTAISLERHVFEHKGPGFVGVAAQAALLCTDGVALQYREFIGVGIMAVATLYRSFQHRVTVGLAEAGFHGSVAACAKICGVCFLEEMRCLLVGVQPVAVSTSDFASPVPGWAERGEEKKSFVTLQAPVRSPNQRTLSEAHGDVVATCLDVGGSVAVAGLTFLLVVGCFGKERSQIVAGHAHVVAQEVLRITGRRRGTTGRKEDCQQSTRNGPQEPAWARSQSLHRAWTLATSNAAPLPWQAPHASPKGAMFKKA